MKTLKTSITNERGRFVGYIGRTRIGSSNRREGAQSLLWQALHVAGLAERGEVVERRIRRARNRAFDFEGTTKNIDKLKLELRRINNRCAGWDVPALRRAISKP